MNITATQDLTMDETTEACDRIYQEVGEDAEIIWGQSFDDDLGDEIRITVIATGIGEVEEHGTEPIHLLDPQPTRTASQPVYASMGSAALKTETDTMAVGVTSAATAPSSEPIARGRVRDLTDEERQNWPDDQVIINRKAAGESAPPVQEPHKVDKDNLDIPTFLRRKAD